jgi:hypothetical protein
VLLQLTVIVFEYTGHGDVPLQLPIIVIGVIDVPHSVPLKVLFVQDDPIDVW